MIVVLDIMMDLCYLFHILILFYLRLLIMIDYLLKYINLLFN